MNLRIFFINIRVFEKGLFQRHYVNSESGVNVPVLLNFILLDRYMSMNDVKPANVVNVMVS